MPGQYTFPTMPAKNNFTGMVSYAPSALSNIGFVPGQVFYDDDFNQYIELRIGYSGTSIAGILIRDHGYHLNEPELLDNDPVIFNSQNSLGFDPAYGYSNNGSPLNAFGLAEPGRWDNIGWQASIFYKVEPFIAANAEGLPVYVSRWISLQVTPKGSPPGTLTAAESFEIEYQDPSVSSTLINPNVAYEYDELQDLLYAPTTSPDSADGNPTYGSGAPAGNAFGNFTYTLDEPEIVQTIENQSPTGLINYSVGSGQTISMVFQPLYYFYNPDDMVKHYDYEFKEI